MQNSKSFNVFNCNLDKVCISSATTVLIWNWIGISDGVIVNPPSQPSRWGSWSQLWLWCALNLFVAVSMIVVMVIVVFVIVIVVIVLVVRLVAIVSLVTILMNLEGYNK